MDVVHFTACLLPLPEDPGSNPVIGNFYWTIFWRKITKLGIPWSRPEHCPRWWRSRRCTRSPQAASRPRCRCRESSLPSGSFQSGRLKSLELLHVIGPKRASFWADRFAKVDGSEKFWETFHQWKWQKRVWMKKFHFEKIHPSLQQQKNSKMKWHLQKISLSNNAS